MNESEIKSKLDRLADFQAHRDLLESDKRALLEDVKIPAEVEVIVKNGMNRLGQIEDHFKPHLEIIREYTDKKLSEIVIPEEIKTALAEIDRQRKAVQDNKTQKENEIREQIRVLKAEESDLVIAQTKDIYAAIAQRKAEIEVEFAGKSEAVDDNIRKLTDEIKAEIVTLKKSVKGDHFHAVYMAGRITWNTDMMEGWRETFPFLEKARKEGDPSVSLRRI